MKHTSLKSATKVLWATILLILGAVSASAQYYQLKVRTNDGQITSFNVESVDSVFFERVIMPIMPIGEAVDLGLSVKWASFNVGASKPEDYGNYYAWGETETKTNYSWFTYKYCNGSYNTLTKYCDYSRYGNNGYTDTKTTLTLEDDVAHVAWGGSWRMPTQAERNELNNSANCTWTWTTQNGVNGYLVTSKKTGHEGASIFLPAAGYRGGTSLDDVGSYGNYWSSSLRPYDPNYAWGVNFNSRGYGANSNSRYIGQSVRPVCP
jgi:hypothetical protein